VVNSKSKKLRIGVLGSGSGSNMQAIIDAIEGGTLDVQIVCALSDQPGAGILQRAQRHNIPAHYLDAAPFKTKLEGSAEALYISKLKEYGAEVVVLAGFMRIVKEGLLRAFPDRVLNIHPALLPAFKGVNAWEQALEYGVKVAGCSVHFVDAGTDTGPIIIQRTVPVMDDDTSATLHARIQQEEHVAYPEALRLLAAGKLVLKGRRVVIE
jgi:phosphoribosylglycinamide formyltransferase-1